jgi:hypothetical protein
MSERLCQSYRQKPKFVSEEDWLIVNKFAMHYDLDPYLLVAIGWHETHWGRLGAGRDGYILGVGVLDRKRRLEQFRGLEAQLRWASVKLSRWFDGAINRETLIRFAVQVWRPGNPTAWGDSVYRIYKDLKRKYDKCRCENDTGN